MRGMNLSKKIYFVIPDPEALQSGGNIYNRNLMEGMIDSGLNVEQADWNQFKELSSHFPEVLFFIDTLYMEQLITFELPSYAYLIVHHLESMYPPNGWTSTAYFETKERPILQRFRGFLVTSHFTRQYLEQHGLGNYDIIVVPPALEVPRSGLRRTWWPIKAIIVGNLVERKGILPFLQALSDVSQEFWKSNLEIQLIGSTALEPTYASHCLELVAELNSIVSYKGVLSHQDTLAQLGEANLLISVAFMETFGMALQEAVASGLPILALQGGNTPYHIDQGNNGFVFSSVEKLIEMLQQIVEKPGSLKVLGEGAVQKQPRDARNWTKAAEEFIGRLDDAL